MTDIQPALTADQWAAGAIFTNGDSKARDQIELCPREGKPDELCIAYGQHDFEVGNAIENRHALAALALYGQKFGFTREHVTFLRKLVQDYQSGDWGFHFEQEIAFATQFAELIEALLPPEKQ